MAYTKSTTKPGGPTKKPDGYHRKISEYNPKTT